MQSLTSHANTDALESKGARFWYYHRNEELGPWHAVPEHELEALLRDASPRYVTVLAVNFCAPTGKDPSRDELEAARYKGPFYIDIDADDLETAIAKCNQLLDRLQNMGVDIHAVRIYCTGGRGFHLELAASMFMSPVPPDGIAKLPLVYRQMASDLYVDTMDLNVYSTKRGRMWRRPNVLRDNDKYKVGVAVEEVRSMTPEIYAELVSARRPEPEWNTPTFHPALALIYEQAAAKVLAEQNKRGRSKRESASSAEAPGTAGLSRVERLIRSVAEAALAHFDELMERWFPEGRHEGPNYVAGNPWRNDRNLGSFKIHRDGFFKDWASEIHKGGDLVALKRFLLGGDCTMLQAARALAEEIGFNVPDTGDDTRSSGVRSEVGEPGSTSSVPPALSVVQSVSGAPRRRPVVIAAMDLLAKEFLPVRWIVNDILPEGLSLLAGSPKTGKSWLVMEVALAVASRGTCLGGKNAMPGTALYLALEDNERRLKDRMTQLLDGGKRPMPTDLHLAVGWPRLDQGGLQHLDDWIVLHPDTRLVVIDTVAKMRKKPTGNSNLCAEDYAVGEDLIQLAHRHRIAVVLVGHTRKAKSDDPVEMISGTLGLPASMDGILVLKRERGQGTASLYVTGRDVPEEHTYGLRWDKQACRWLIEGDAGEVLVNDARRVIVAVLRRENRPLSARQIADMSGREYDATRRLLPAMVSDSIIDAFDQGNRRMYVHAAYQAPTSRLADSSNNPPNAHSAPIPPLYGGVLSQAPGLRAKGAGGKV
jgi:hypothetical protein